MHKYPLKSAGFMVLKAPDVPSVLVELGYVSTPLGPQAAHVGDVAEPYRRRDQSRRWMTFSAPGWPATRPGDGEIGAHDAGKPQFDHKNSANFGSLSVHEPARDACLPGSGRAISRPRASAKSYDGAAVVA